ncbi:MAG TPA: hypothetical protein VLZ77_00895 [Acidimicrobiales bacterium]|nr:hypothetical protein [Acidimicrobiales bacterium]
MAGGLSVVIGVAVAPGVAAAGPLAAPSLPGPAVVLPAPAAPLVGGVLGSAPPSSGPGAGSSTAPSTAPSGPAHVSTGTGTQTVAAGGAPSITITPDSGLTNGQKVTVKGAGFTPASAGGMAECNNAPNQPTMSVEGNAVPVGCTNPLNSLASTNTSGGFTATFTVRTGTIGPPAQGSTDSAGHSAAADAAAYPCPPTAAQAAAGITCGISYGDASGKQASADLHFAAAAGSATSSTAAGGSGAAGGPGSATGAGGAPGATSTRASGSGAGSGSSGTGAVGTAPGGSSAAGGGSLPLTGLGIGLVRLAMIGVVLVLSGSLLVVLGRRRRASLCS